MHERFCVVHISRCEICKQPVLNDDLEDHLLSCVTTHNCKYCGQIIAKLENEHHLDHECKMRPKNCKYCTILLYPDEKQHEVHCGSRTEICPDCDEPILIKDYKNHTKYQCLKEQKFSDCISIANYISVQKRKAKIIPCKTQSGVISSFNDFSLIYSNKSNSDLAKKGPQEGKAFQSEAYPLFNNLISSIHNENINSKKFKQKKKKYLQNSNDEKNVVKQLHSKKKQSKNLYDFEDFKCVINFETKSIENDHQNEAGLMKPQSSKKKDARGNIQCNSINSMTDVHQMFLLKNSTAISKYSEYYFD